MLLIGLLLRAHNARTILHYAETCVKICVMSYEWHHDIGQTMYIVLRHQPQPVEHPGVLLAAGHKIDPGSIDAGMAQHVG